MTPSCLTNKLVYDCDAENLSEGNIPMNFEFQALKACLSPYNDLINLQTCFGYVAFTKPCGCFMYISSCISPCRMHYLYRAALIPNCD